MLMCVVCVRVYVCVCVGVCVVRVRACCCICRTFMNRVTWVAGVIGYIRSGPIFGPVDRIPEYGPPRTQLPREYGPPDRVPWLHKTN